MQTHSGLAARWHGNCDGLDLVGAAAAAACPI